MNEELSVKVMVWKRKLFLRPNPPVVSDTSLLGRRVSLRVLSPRDLEGMIVVGVWSRYPGKPSLGLVIALSRRWYLADLGQFKGRTIRVRLEQHEQHA
jgi:hypothetical protein